MESLENVGGCRSVAWRHGGGVLTFLPCGQRRRWRWRATAVAAGGGSSRQWRQRRRAVAGRWRQQQAVAAAVAGGGLGSGWAGGSRRRRAVAGRWRGQWRQRQQQQQAGDSSGGSGGGHWRRWPRRQPEVSCVFCSGVSCCTKCHSAHARRGGCARLLTISHRPRGRPGNAGAKLSLVHRYSTPLLRTTAEFPSPLVRYSLR
jgi:hypothetical protein